MTRFSVALLALMFAVGSAEAQSYSPEEFARRAQERRAVEAVIWAMPAVKRRTPTPSTTSPRKRALRAPSRSSSAVATATFRTACP
jgi:hypothetical protein